MGDRRDANLTNWEGPNWVDDNHHTQEEYEEDDYRGSLGDRARDVLFSRNENEPPSDLDWVELGTYGADSKAVQYLENNEGARNYEELKNKTDVEAYKVFAKDDNLRENKGKFPMAFKQFKNRMGGGRKSVFKK